MSTNPLFSIVIPTRNRANLLPNALQSAMEQTHNDYEIIVSSNNSTDETEQVVRRLGDSRVRYVRTDRDLPMADSWEFALSHARGDYVTLLSDDDALSPTLLERLDKLLIDRPVKLISWNRFLYIMDDWYVESDRNRLFLGPVSGRAQEESSESMLRQWFDGCHYYSQAPMLFNACCHRSIIESVKKKAGRFFLGTSPDIAASIALLSTTPSFTLVDDVFSLAGSGRQSIGGNTMYNRGNALQVFISELDDDAFPRGPFKATMLTTGVADTLITLKEALPGSLANYEINWANYFINCYKDIMQYEKNGVDISGERKQLWKLILKQPQAIKVEFLRFVMSSVRAGAEMPEERTQLWKLALAQPPAIKLDFLRFVAGVQRRKLRNRPSSELTTPTPVPNPYVISGTEAGFTNILECARMLDSFVSRIKRGELPLSNS
jgi:glycosyltransferase involved in cell wall biosynthesis